MEANQAFGVSPTAGATHLIEATTRKLETFKELSLNDFTPSAVSSPFLSTRISL